MTAEEPFADGFAALGEGRWEQARSAFEVVLARGEAETAEARFGLAMALWWLGENHACVGQCGRAYALFRASGEIGGAARCAVWLAITYKSNFSAEVYDRIKRDVREVLAPFTADDGTLEAPFRVHVVAGIRSA